MSGSRRSAWANQSNQERPLSQQEAKDYPKPPLAPTRDLNEPPAIRSPITTPEQDLAERRQRHARAPASPLLRTMHEEQRQQAIDNANVNRQAQRDRDEELRKKRHRASQNAEELVQRAEEEYQQHPPTAGQGDKRMHPTQQQVHPPPTGAPLPQQPLVQPPAPAPVQPAPAPILAAAAIQPAILIQPVIAAVPVQPNNVQPVVAQQVLHHPVLPVHPPAMPIAPVVVPMPAAPPQRQISPPETAQQATGLRATVRR